MPGNIYRMENSGGAIEGGLRKRLFGSVIYRGAMNPDAVGPQVVTRNGQLLDPKPSQKLYNHSPDGFQWGYGGSGPAQLALALLLDATGNPALALSQHQNFKHAFVEGFDNRWQLSRNQIKDWLKSLDRRYDTCV